MKRGGLVGLDDESGSQAFVKQKNKKGELVDTPTFSDEDLVALDYQFIQKTCGESDLKKEETHWLL